MGARVLLCCSIIWFSTASNAAADRLPSRGFETGSDAAAEGWRPFEQGYRISRDPVRSGARALECANAAYDDRRGATATVELSQREPRPILVEGWSKARDVGGFRNNDYSIYLDLEHTDGTPLWGQTAPFSVGTHEWQRRRVLVFPTKPIKRVHVHALFRHHTGTAWFDDFTLRELDAGSTFDGQPLKPPAISRGTTYGWFVRDVAADGPIRSVTPAPVAGGTPALRSAATGAPTDAALKARLSQRSQSNGRLLAARIADTSGAARRLTVYYAERLPVGAQTWWTDMRRGVRCASVGEYANLTRIGVGATGMISLYPLACMTGPKLGRAIGVDPLSGPVVVRFGYHAASRLLYAAFDVALLPDNTRNSHAGRGHADLRIVRWDVDPAWGFRSACARYYAMFPEAFDRRARADGIWIPFTDPSSVRDVSDFGIAYHEGDNSIAGDDRLGILSFRYTEPMTWWMPMDPAMPRTYEAALDLVRRHLAGAQSGTRDLAQAVINSGSHDEGGRFNVEFQNAPWTNGAVWVLNPNPAMPRPNGQATKASLSYTPAMGDRMYGRLTGGTQDGEYLDSIEGWADVLDYRQESLRLSSVPPTFETDALRPVVPTWFSVWELARTMRDDLRKRGKLLMANATPWRIHAFAPLLDVMGTEVNWQPAGTWRPDPDSIFCLRRALCYRKPYLLLQNTDFDQFGVQQVERYFQRCMFYGVFPSMFSVDASTRNYWTQPQWYERDRDLFRKYIPVVAALSREGWEPITGAWTGREDVYVERYGRRYVTLLNDSQARRDVSLSMDPRVFAASQATVALQDVLTGERVSVRRVGARLVARVSVAPEQCRVLRVVGTKP